MEPWVGCFVGQVFTHFAFLAFAGSNVDILLVCPAWANVAFRGVPGFVDASRLAWFAITEFVVVVHGKSSDGAFFADGGRRESNFIQVKPHGASVAGEVC